jgi:hypothetical protein
MKFINAYYTNASSVIGKIHELREFIKNSNIDLIGITESWCHEKIGDAEVQIDGFNLFRGDRTDERDSGELKRGGGVILYVRDSLKSVPCSEMNRHKFKEMTWSVVTLENNNKLLVGVIYRSPYSNEANNEELLNVLKQSIIVNCINQILIMGDFNYPEISYELGSVDGPEISGAKSFFKCTQNLGLHENIQDITRFRGLQTPSKLDYIFTLDDRLIDNITKHPPLGKSDHIGIEVRLLVSVQEIVVEGGLMKKNYWKADFQKINDKITNTNWKNTLGDGDIETMWQSFKDHVLELEDMCHQDHKRKNYVKTNG